MATRAVLADVVALGDTRQSLEAVRDALAATLTKAMGADPDKQSQVAAVAKQLRDTIVAINALPVPKQESTVDELKKRRAARRAPAKTSTRTKGAVVSRSGGSRAGGKRRPAAGSVAGNGPARSAQGA